MSSSNLPQVPENFKGWVAKDKDAIGNLVHEEFTPKPFTEDDVDIAITHCGVCASDLHTLRSGWGATDYPQVVGHEIVGVAVRVGKNVPHVKIGQRVGVGAQADSCRSCGECKAEREPYCAGGMVPTYHGRFKDGSKSFGGYANFERAPGHFVVPIPDGIPSAVAAPMLCGGATVYSPLKQYGAGTERKRVGVVGIGGLGHFALLFAKAMGAEVTAVSHSPSKKADAEKMGATHFIATGSEGPDVFKNHQNSLDLLICTTNDPRMPLDGYIQLLAPHGYLVFVGVPEEPIPQFRPGALIFKNAHLGGSLIGSPAVIRDMFEVVSKENVRTWIQEVPMNTVNQAVVDMENGKARYRYVLVNEDHKHLARE